MCFGVPTRKVQGLGVHKHLRVLTGTPCLIRDIQASLLTVTDGILRELKLASWVIPQSLLVLPELLIAVTGPHLFLWRDLGNRLSRVKHQSVKGPLHLGKSGKTPRKSPG